jgi:hypothetical protein
MQSVKIRRDQGKGYAAFSFFTTKSISLILIGRAKKRASLVPAGKSESVNLDPYFPRKLLS